jgi:hypothetical protein
MWHGVPVPGIGVYVMRTFRDFFHMGSVECVTDHVPDRKESEGAAMVAVALAETVGSADGGRRVIMVIE